METYRDGFTWRSVHIEEIHARRGLHRQGIDTEGVHNGGGLHKDGTTHRRGLHAEEIICGKDLYRKTVSGTN